MLHSFILESQYVPNLATIRPPKNTPMDRYESGSSESVDPSLVVFSNKPVTPKKSVTFDVETVNEVVISSVVFSKPLVEPGRSVTVTSLPFIVETGMTIVVTSLPLIAAADDELFSSLSLCNRSKGLPGRKTDTTHALKQKIWKTEPKSPVALSPSLLRKTGYANVPAMPNTDPTAMNIPSKDSEIPCEYE